MNTVQDQVPAVSATRDGRFPSRARFDAVWEEILQASGTWSGIDCSGYVQKWCGTVPDGITESLVGVNHIGLYLGDYTRDEEVLDWNSYLRDLRSAERISSVEMGPSYISPRQYGTQGWWNSCRLPDGRTIETFMCKSYGPWLERPVDERRRLMSHVAIDVRSEPDVQRVLRALDDGVDALETIAFTEADELGHTYGHVRNNASKIVLEIVHQAPQGEHVPNDGGR
ncbi:hypothetical protein AQI95_17945 [Streptomyces yokosukanensis]|uniref:Uncharacterized protein n=1 Tax=Streptomyces yokosukanensis TaxID=67386 RepID=A0A101P4H0_9ACTN|nr:hypothetical protein [Streptomyces yokosukanensis]KUN04775.1 hypothetical protein AQI95_17945 [Streptomyces yokosukanensis]